METQTMTTATYKFFHDPGHGWLQVTRADCAQVGLTVEDFSPYSYQTDTHLYLEEDCDAPRFTTAYQAKHGRVHAVEAIYQEKTPIRSYQHMRNQLPRMSAFAAF